MFTLGGLLKLFGDLFAVIGPLAIQQIVQYIENMYNIQTTNSNNNALVRINTSKSNITNSSDISRGNNNTSITAPEIQSSTSPLSSSSSLSSLLSLEGNGNLVQGIRSHINIQAAVVKTIQQVVTQAKDIAAATGASTAATGSVWLPNFNASYTNDNNTNITANPGNIFYNNNGNNTSTNGYNQIANGIDYIDTTSYPSESSSSSFHSSDLYSSGAEVKIYYPSWLDLLSNGWAIAWIVLLAALAQGALSQASTHILNMTGIRIKTSLQGLIYRKTLLLNSTCIGGGGSSTNHSSNTYTNDDATVTNTITPETGNKIENSVNSNCYEENNQSTTNNCSTKDSNYLKGIKKKKHQDDMENCKYDKEIIKIEI